MSNPVRTGRALTTFTVLALAVFSSVAQADHDPPDTFHLHPAEAFRAISDGTFAMTATNDGLASIEQVVLQFPTAGTDDAITITAAEAATTDPPGDTWNVELTDTDEDGTFDQITATGANGAGQQREEVMTITITFEGRAVGPSEVEVEATATDSLDVEHTHTATQEIHYPGIVVTDPDEDEIDPDDPIVMQEDPSIATSFTLLVALRAVPTDDVTVEASSDHPADVEYSLDGSTWSPSVDLDFTPDDWDVEQTVLMRPVSDIIDEGTHDAAELRFRGTSDDDDYDVAETIGVLEITDDDDASITLSESLLQVSEAGTLDSFTLSPDTRPSDDLVITVTSTRPAEAKIADPSAPNDASKDATSRTLTFTQGTAQTITIRGQDDGIADGSHTGFLRFTLASANQASEYVGKMPSDLRFFNDDNDAAGLTIRQLTPDCDDDDAETVVRESAGQNVGTTDCLSVRLNTQPSGSVEIDVTTSDSDRLTADPATLTFTTSNWNTPQTVEVTAVDDDVVGTTAFVDVVFTVDDSSASEYRDITNSRSVRVLDDEDASIRVDPSSLSLAEGDETTFHVRLGAEPTEDTTVEISSDGLTFSPSSVTFTPGNFDDEQTVTVSAAQNDVLDGTRTQDVLLIVTESGPEYADVSNTIEIEVEDDEEAGIEFDGPTWVEIGDSVDVRARLTAEPAGTVEVDVTTNRGSVSPTTLTFNAQNWDSYRSLQVDAPPSSGGQAVTELELTITVDAAASHDAWDDASSVHAIRAFDYEFLDLAQINTDLQDSVTVAGDTVHWDTSEVEIEPIGVQVWRATSPFAIIASVHEGTDDFEDEEYTDSSAPDGAYYIVTAFYGDTERSGFFGPGASLSDVPGYEGTTEAEQKERAGLAGGDGGIPQWVWILIGALVLILIVVLIVVLVARRKRRDEPEEPWEPAPAYEQAPPTRDETAWAPEAPAAAQQEFHVTCPECSHDFDVVGVPPVRSRCPQCGVQGLVR